MRHPIEMLANLFMSFIAPNRSFHILLPVS